MSRPYFPALDGLRAVAVLLVLGVHAAVPLVAGGDIGVDLFFVLSGFLITGILVGEYEATGHIHFLDFYWRRFLRIVPPMVFVLAVFYLFAPSIPIGREWLRHDAWVVLGSVADYSRAKGMGPDYFSNAWSLSVEEQFYFIWPMLCLLLLRSFADRRRVATIVVALALAVACWRAYNFLSVSGEIARDPRKLYRIYDGFDTRADALLVGCLIALVPPPFRRHLGRLWPIAIALFALCAFLSSTNDRWMYLGGYTVIAVLAGILISSIVTDPATPLARLLALRPARFLGRISYAVYLWHFPIVIVFHQKGLNNWVEMLPSSALAIAFAVVSYYAIERPAAKLKDLDSRAAKIMGAATMPLFFLAGSVALFVAK